MKRFALFLVVLVAATAPLAAQGRGRVALSTPPISVSALRSASSAAAKSSGMTGTERGALYGAIVGAVAGAVIIALGDEKGLGNSLLGGIIFALPVSLIGAIIGSM